MHLPANYYKSLELAIDLQHRNATRLKEALELLQGLCNHKTADGQTAFEPADHYGKREICQNCGLIRYR